MPPTPAEMKDFLEVDLSHVLKELFVGAVAWEAGRRSELCPFQKDLGMYASFVQARALYEFYSSKPTRKRKGQELDDARASQFVNVGKWTDIDSRSKLYVDYMDDETPANKRVFHLVYGRSAHPAIKDQVLAFAAELLTITREFRDCVDLDYRASVECALQKALTAASEAAKDFKSPNPLV
jgi:hypothetical protein